MSNTIVNDAIYSQLETLLSYRFHVKHRQLNAQQKLISAKAGYQQAVRRGRGMEFNEVREYTAGDDIRHIDWKVSARTQKIHTKLFTEEVERPVLVLLEQSPKLFFGSQVRFKSVQALNLATFLAWVSLQEGNRFGGYVFNHLHQQWIEAKHQQKTLLQFLHACMELQQEVSQPNIDGQNWQTHLAKIQPYIKSGSRVFLIGDFLDVADGFFETLSQLKHLCELVLIHVYDPIEKALPLLSNGELKLTDGFEQLTIDTQLNTHVFETQYQQSWKRVLDHCYRLHIPLLEVSTQEDALTSLLSQKVIR